MTREDSRIQLLVVDDEQSIRRLCMTGGGPLGCLCSEAESAEAALARSPAVTPDIVIADLRLPNLSGADLLRQIKSRLPATEVGRVRLHPEAVPCGRTQNAASPDGRKNPARAREQSSS